MRTDCERCGKRTNAPTSRNQCYCKEVDKELAERERKRKRETEVVTFHKSITMESITEAAIERATSLTSIGWCSLCGGSQDMPKYFSPSHLTRSNEKCNDCDGDVYSGLTYYGAFLAEEK